MIIHFFRDLLVLLLAFENFSCLQVYLDLILNANHGCNRQQFVMYSHCTVDDECD